MNELQLKYNSLDAASQKEVIDFIDFLSQKISGSKNSAPLTTKKKPLPISKWSEEDIKVIEDAQTLIRFNPEKW